MRLGPPQITLHFKLLLTVQTNAQTMLLPHYTIMCWWNLKHEQIMSISCWWSGIPLSYFWLFGKNNWKSSLHDSKPIQGPKSSVCTPQGRGVRWSWKGGATRGTVYDVLHASVSRHHESFKLLKRAIPHPSCPHNSKQAVAMLSYTPDMQTLQFRSSNQCHYQYSRRSQRRVQTPGLHLNPQSGSKVKVKLLETLPAVAKPQRGGLTCFLSWPGLFLHCGAQIGDPS